MQVVIQLSPATNTLTPNIMTYFKNIKCIIIAAVVAAVMGVAGCHHHHDHHHDHDELEQLPPNTVHFHDEQAELSGVEVITLEAKKSSGAIRATAQIMPTQCDERIATASASGVVVMDKEYIVEGSYVTAGQRLMSISSSGMASGNMSVRRKEEEAEYQAARTAYERKQQLAADRIVTESDVEQARARYERAKAEYDNLQGNFSATGAVVKAPISGYITSIMVSNGGFVEAGQAVVAVAKNKDLYLKAEIPSRHYNELKEITGANIVMPNGEVKSLEELDGNLVGYGKATGTANPLIPVTFRIRNTGGLLPGSFLTIYIVTTGDGNALMLPNEGIVEEMGEKFVFVNTAEELYEKRLVQTGLSNGLETEIKEGVKAGERVVSKGAIMLKLAQGAGALDPHAGHVH